MKHFQKFLYFAIILTKKFFQNIEILLYIEKQIFFVMKNFRDFESRFSMHNITNNQPQITEKLEIKTQTQFQFRKCENQITLCQ